MPRYHFDLQNNARQIEDLGGVVLADDGEALAFAKRVIRELLDKNPSSTRAGPWTSLKASGPSAASLSN
jgi:hypothetical protein